MAKIVKRNNQGKTDLREVRPVKRTGSVNEVKVVKKNNNDVKVNKEVRQVKEAVKPKEVKLPREVGETKTKEVVKQKEMKLPKETVEVKEVVKPKEEKIDTDTVKVREVKFSEKVEEPREVRVQKEIVKPSEEVPVKEVVETKEVKKENKPKKNGFKKFLTFLFVLVLIIGGGFAAWKFVFNKEEKVKQEIKEIDNLTDYGYTLTDNDSKYFKNEFEELKKILNEKEMDEEAYVTQVAKMFVIDLYSLNTKVNKYDIGGLEYYHVNKKDMYELKVMDTLYSIVLDNTFGDRKQELPEVSGVEVTSVDDSTYKLGDKKVDSYEVKLVITYVKDMGYDKDVTVTLVQENNSNRWSVVESIVNNNKK